MTNSTVCFRGPLAVGGVFQRFVVFVGQSPNVTASAVEALVLLAERGKSVFARKLEERIDDHL